MTAISERQRRILEILQADTERPGNPQGIGAGAVAREAFGVYHANHGLTPTLDAMQRLGLVREVPLYSGSRNWRITDKGKETLAASV